MKNPLTLTGIKPAIFRFQFVPVALFIKYAKRMRNIIFSSVVCLTLTHFSTLSHKRHDFRQKVTEHEICVFIFLYKVFLKYFSF